MNNKDIKIKRFRPFTLSPKSLAKKIVILETNKILVNDKTKDTPIFDSYKSLFYGSARES